MRISDAATRALTELADQCGGALTPAVVVDEARASESPLHHYFEWDDSEAAHAYRLAQARALLRVAVQYVPAEQGTQIRCRVFASLSSDRTKDGAGYRLVSVVMADEQMRQQMLADARAEMVRFRVKYKTLEELADVFAAIDEVVELTRDQPSVAEPVAAAR